MVNRDQLIAYLLHQMPEHEREAFSERCFTELELSENVRQTEADLLDTYARGSMPAEQRKQVERWLLSSPPQHRKLEFARAMAAVFPSPQPSRIPWTAVVAVAAALLLAVFLSVLMVRNQRLQSELARVESQRAAGQAPFSGTTFAFFLPSGVLRSSAGVSFSLPKGVEVLHLQLGLDLGAESQAGSAVVSTADRAVWRQQPVSTEGTGSAARASLWIPANLLAPGHYIVRLESNGAPVAYYEFTLR